MVMWLVIWKNKMRRMRLLKKMLMQVVKMLKRQLEVMMIEVICSLCDFLIHLWAMSWIICAICVPFWSVI